MGIDKISKQSLSVFLLFAAALQGAPKLRLNGTAVGPVSVAVGANTTAPSVEATNLGTGTLSLTATSAVPWIVPKVQAVKPCGGFGQPCIPITFALNTASLAKGTHTGIVTISDPNALDAPQNITVTVEVGGAVPDKLDLWVAPGNVSAASFFTTNAPVTVSATTNNGGPWLSVSQTGGGTGTGAPSDSPIYTYKVVANPFGLGEGTYTGSIRVVGGSTNPYDTKTVAVTMHITSGPIATPSSTGVRFRIAANSAKQTRPLVLVNSGAGTLSVSQVTADGSPTWLATAVDGNVVSLVADPAGLQPGSYTTTLSVATNGANGTVSVPVTLDVPATSGPVVAAQGAVNNTIYEQGDNVAPGAIISLFGEQLTTGTPVGASKVPLDAQLGGARVLVNGVPAPLFYVSYNQINFQLPFETQAGEAVVKVERDGQAGNATYVKVMPAAPRILRLGIKDYAVVVNQDGTLVMPTTPGIPSHPAKAGDVLVVWGSGLGQSAPPLASGNGATVDPLNRVPNVRVELGTRGFGDPVEITPDFAGYAPLLVGSTQVNFRVPANAPKGAEIPLTISVGTGSPVPSNRVTIAIQ